MRATAAATARHETALLVTQPRESALLWEAQTRSPKCVVVMAAASARRICFARHSIIRYLVALGGAGTLVNA
jgi:hypothetical protein